MIKIGHFQLEIEEYRFCSNYPFICINYKVSCCCQMHQIIMNLSLCFVKHFTLLTVLHSFMHLITTYWIFLQIIFLLKFSCQNWLVWWLSVFWWSYCHADVNTFRGGVSKLNIALKRPCSVYSYLKGIWNIWNIISMKYKSLENIRFARKHVNESFLLNILKKIWLLKCNRYTKCMVKLECTQINKNL